MPRRTVARLKSPAETPDQSIEPTPLAGRRLMSIVLWRCIFYSFTDFLFDELR